MFSNKVCLIIVLVCCFCSMGMAVLTNKLNPIPSFVVGGNPNYDTVNDHYDSNCSQFVDDMDILRQLPFKVLVEPDDGVEANMSIVQLNADMTTVRLIMLSGVPLLPSSLFCLSKLDDLTLFNVPLKDNILPEGVTKLQTLRELSINDVPILKIGDHLSKLRNLSTLVLNNCSLTSLPDLSHLNFIMLSVEHNNLTHFKGSINTEMLNIEDNSFRTLPVLSHPEKIIFLDVSQNPLKTITPVLKYKKLQVLAASDAEITFIPPNIDRLEDLNMIILANNKLTHLPINILNLPELEYLDVRSNLFSSVQIRSIKQTIKKNHPKLEFEI